jgi:hypothetical protein
MAIAPFVASSAPRAGIRAVFVLPYLYGNTLGSRLLISNVTMLNKFANLREENRWLNLLRVAAI